MRTITAILTLTLSLTFTATAQSRRRTSNPPTPFPGCTMITGTPAVTFTRDEGRTLAPSSEPLSGIGYTYGLAALDTPGTLLSWHKNTLSISTDHGCSWRALGDYATDFPPSITAARGGRAFAWSDNREFLLRYDSRGPAVLKAPATIVGLGTDPVNGDRVLIGDAEGKVWESKDAGDTWTEITRLPREALAQVYRFSFDPANLAHFIAGTITTGAFVTFDGGTNWSRSTSLGDSFNVMNFAISPVDPNVVWAMAVDVRDGNHAIHRSADGGRSFAKVVESGASITVRNQPVMAAHPTDPNLLYFVFGTRFQGYGTDLFRVDATGDVRLSHNGNDDVDSIAFSRSDPTVMYLGLETEKGVN